MSFLCLVPAWLAFAFAVGGGEVVDGGTADDRASLERTTAAIRDGFGRGDVAAVVALHHPNVEKFFGGTNVVKGRADLERGLKSMFEKSRIEFVDHKLESLVFEGTAAIETSIFTMRVTGRKSQKSSISRGRAMVVYVRSKESPTGWVSIREMAQAAPPAG